MSTDQLIDQSAALFRAALEEKAPAIMEAMNDSAEGAHSFSCGVKLNRVNNRVYLKLTLRHSTKDSVELEESFEVEDKTQLKLGVVS